MRGTGSDARGRGRKGGWRLTATAAVFLNHKPPSSPLPAFQPPIEDLAYAVDAAATILPFSAGCRG